MNDIDEKAASMGLQTKLWGSHMWEAVHSISFGYPVKPTEQDKKNYKAFFIVLKFVLPCIFCRRSYSEFIITEPTVLNDSVLESRETLTKWVYMLHERVNKKLGVTYGVKYEDVCKRYEAYRAKCDPIHQGCIMPVDEKTKSFEIASKKHYPIITYQLAESFKSYADLRGVKFDKIDYYDKMCKNISSEEWEARNKECGDLIQFMRINGIPSTELSGEYKGLPTIHELLLISKLSSTLCMDDLNKISRKINK